MWPTAEEKQLLGQIGALRLERTVYCCCHKFILIYIRYDTQYLLLALKCEIVKILSKIQRDRTPLKGNVNKEE